jgi:hypothetical protein
MTTAASALDGETLTALRAASVDDLAAAGGLHAHAEAMGALATGDGRLISTFHVALTFLCEMTTEGRYSGPLADCTARRLITASLLPECSISGRLATRHSR